MGSSHRFFLFSFCRVRSYVIAPRSDESRRPHIHHDERRTPDKVHDGPCAAQFSALDKCAKTKDPRRFKVM